ncbi:hypothetical protein AB833_30660 [Chromatiales bacterium (ex Bugula neritina AB1)]|nr:hypothetical protein AB833_30660 [Chromatiales bacterium (ex Bugula neritina AB1)]
MNNSSSDTTIDNYEELLPIRMALPELDLTHSAAQPENLSATTRIYIDQLFDLGFIYSHEITVENPVGKYENEKARIIAYLNVDENVYALITNLYHVDTWVHFTSYYAQGQRIVTTSQPGALILEPMQKIANIEDLIVQNSGSSPLDSQWKKHRRLTASRLPDDYALLLRPDQHLAIERGFYLRYVTHLLESNILQQSDTQTVRFTRSGARAFHTAITSRSARSPQPKVEEWIGKRGKVPIRPYLNNRNAAIAASTLLAASVMFNYLGKESVVESHDNSAASASAEIVEPALLAGRAGPDSDVAVVRQLPTTNDRHIAPVLRTEPEKTAATKKIEKQREQLVVASAEDEMWRIAVENAEFYLMSNDGDPAPWVRTARKIAAGFKSNDSRLARTYFLTALLEQDYRIAEQHYNRALSIQTKTLGLYHPETAQTLEALAWVAERNKDALEEAITHQRLAVNIYSDLYGTDSEDTKAASWKLEYFEDRLAGSRPRSDAKRRLLPALARFAIE